MECRQCDRPASVGLLCAECARADDRRFPEFTDGRGNRRYANPRTLSSRGADERGRPVLTRGVGRHFAIDAPNEREKD